MLAEASALQREPHRKLMRGAKVTDCGSARQGEVPSGKTAVTNVISGLGQPAKTAPLRCQKKIPRKRVQSQLPARAKTPLLAGANELPADHGRVAAPNGKTLSRLAGSTRPDTATRKHWLPFFYQTTCL